MKGTEKAASSTPLRKSDSRNNVSSRRLLEEEEEDLRQNLLTIVSDKVKENSPDPEEYGGAVLISSPRKAEHEPKLGVGLSKQRSAKLKSTNSGITLSFDKKS